MRIHSKPMAIEKFLPSEFIFSLGAYLQTCAYIEVASASLIACLEGDRPEDPNWKKRYYQLRKTPLTDLTKILKKSASGAKKYNFSTQLELLADWLSQYKGNRHMAAHGAFIGSPYGFFRVDYVNQIGAKKANQYEATRVPVSREDIVSVCEDADRVYLSLVGMLEAIETNLARRAFVASMPIVEHPDV